MRFHRCDVRRPIELADVDASALVFNLAAVHRTPGHADHEYHETNELGARHVTGFCEATGVTDLWFTSSIAVYGATEAAVTEASPLQPATAYGRSKAAAETIHEAVGERSSRPAARDRAPGHRLRAR